MVYVYMNKEDMKKMRKLERGGDEKERNNEGFKWGWKDKRKERVILGTHKNAQLCATTHHVASCEWWKCVPT